MRIDSSARRSISRAPVGPPARPVAITGRSRSLRARATFTPLPPATVLASTARWRLPCRKLGTATVRSIAAFRVTVRIIPFLLPAPSAGASGASSPRASCASPLGSAVVGIAAGPAELAGPSLLGASRPAPSAVNSNPTSITIATSAIRTNRILGGRYRLVERGGRADRVSCDQRADGGRLPSTLTTTRPSTSPCRAAPLTSSGAVTCVVDVLALPHVDRAAARLAIRGR